MPSSSQSRVAPLVGLATIIFTADALAFDTDYYVGARVASTDNIFLVTADQNEENETPVSAIAGIQVSELSSLLELSGEAGFQYIDYIENTFNNELLANASVDAEFFILPQRFHWTIDDDYGQVLGDSLAVPDPSNRENTNVFVTGPNVFFRISNRDVLALSGRFVDDWYEDQDYDNQRTILGGSYRRNLAGERSIGLFVSQMDVEYESYTDYDRKDAFFRFESETSKSSLKVDVGYSEIAVDPQVTEGDGLSVESESSGLLFATEFTREISGATRITAKYGNSYSDSGERFRELNEAGNGVDMNAEDVNVSDEPFRLQEFMLSVDRSTNIDNLSIQLGFDDEDYTQSSEDDRQRKNLYMSYMRRITTALRLGLNANYSQQEYSQEQRENKDWSVSLVGTFDLTENIGLQLSLGPRKRTSSGANPGSDFKESRALLEIVYATGSYRG
jgi:hypothetical protein